jgi:hypothetical protein
MLMTTEGVKQMASSKKDRGRPKGSERDDSAMLASIASLMFGDPKLKPTTAMRRIDRNASDADIRRWQVKWKDRKHILLVKAAASSEDEERKKAQYRAELNRIIKAAQSRTIYDLPESALNFSLAFNPSAADLAAMGHNKNDHVMRRILGKGSNAYERIMRQMEDDPIERIIRHMNNDPISRIARGLADDPIARAARKQQEMLDKFTKFGGL